MSRNDSWEWCRYLPQIVCETDLQGNIVYINDIAFTLFRYQREDMDKGLNVFQMLAPKDLEKARNNFYRVIQGEKINGKEYTALRKDGTTFPVIIFSSLIRRHDQPAGIRAIVVDITAQKLQLSEQLHFSHALNKMSQALIPKEDAKAVLGIIAHTIKETLGTERVFIIKVILQEEWLDKKLEGSAHGSYVYLSRLFSEEHLPEDIQAEALDLSLMTNSIKYIWTKRTWLESHKGAVHPSFEQDQTKDHFHDFLNIQSLLWYPFFFNNNGCYIIALNQISNERSWRKEEIQFLESVTNLGELALQKSYLYAEHIRQRQEIRRLDRLNLVGQLAANIGHEVRNPMTTVRGFLQLLSKQQKNCADMGSHFKLMIEELDRANQIITDFLQLAKNPVEQFNLQSLNDILSALVPMIQAEAFSSGHHAVVEIGSVPELWLDEKQIKQLILNLVRNGLEAMQEPGRLLISTATTNEDVVLSVEDQGTGMDEETKSRLGTPFFTTKEQGTGLGLSVCYGVAKGHKAKIEVDSKPGKTIFSVHFPLGQK